MKFIFFAALVFIGFSGKAQTRQYYTTHYQPTADTAQANSYTETITADSLVANVKTFSMKGVLESEDNYSNLKKRTLEGISKSWFENGKLKSEVMYKAGKLDGPVKSYHKNGQLKRNEVYKSDELVTGKCFATTGADTTYFAYRVYPQFPGGEKALFKYLTSNIHYPRKARKKGIEGRVFISFVIDRDGTVTDKTILKSVSPELDAEAERVITNMPKWSPAIQDGEKVKVRFTLPLNFKLNS